MDDMATAIGVDLEEATLRGDLPFDQISDMVLRCTGCTHPEDCQKWLAENHKADTPPSYCRNGAELKALRR